MYPTLKEDEILYVCSVHKEILRKMKVLNLFSDWKWTGPAEPVLSLCEALENEGVDIILAYRKAPLDFNERTVEKETRKEA